VRNFGDARRAHLGRFRRFFDSMLQQGVYLAPSAFESGFVSLAHRRKDLDETLDAAETAFYRAARLR
jgi:glutamate-1-semialdehyde 2,1-aminomutase